MDKETIFFAIGLIFQAGVLFGQVKSLRAEVKEVKTLLLKHITREDT
jgi:hypothetical protein